jgi:hypothetical protein
MKRAFWIVLNEAGFMMRTNRHGFYLHRFVIVGEIAQDDVIKNHFAQPLKASL